MGELQRTEPGGIAAKPPNGDLYSMARKLEDQVIAIKRDIEVSWIKLAIVLHQCKEQRVWELLDYDSEAQWLRSPDINVVPSYFHKLTRAVEQLVVKRKVPLAELKGVPIENVIMVLPAVEAGDENWKDALDLARSLGRHDLKAALERGSSTPLDATAEPVRVECEHCGSWYTPKEEAA